MDISLYIGNLKLSSPLILGSFDPLVDAAVIRRCFEICGNSLGAVVTKSTTFHPRSGYPHPTVAKFGDGLLVASGNPNPGIEKMAKEIRAIRSQNSTAVVFGSIVNDPDHPTEDLVSEYRLLASRFAEAGVNGVELNLSCPHLDRTEKEQTIVPAQNASLVASLVGGVKSDLTEKGHGNCVVIAKLTGWNCNPVEVALAAEQAGADAVTISNLFPGTGYYTGLGPRSPDDSPEQEIGSYLLGNHKGGFSGKAMHSAVLLLIESLRKHLRTPVIGTGGCASDLDSLVQTFMAGAAAVETVTPFYFRNQGEMNVLSKVNELMAQLKTYLVSLGLGKAQELHGYREKSHQP